METKEFDSVDDAYNYLYGVSDGQIDVGDYDYIKIEFIKDG